MSPKIENIRASKPLNKTRRNVRVDVEQHSLPLTIALHLLPGLLVVIVIASSGTFFKNMGLPHHLLAFLFGGVFVLSTMQLGMLVYLGLKLNGQFSFEGIVLYRQPIPSWQYLALGLPLLFWVALVWLTIVPPINTFFIDNFFSWMPDTFFMDSFQEHYGEYSQSTLLLLGIQWVLFVGVIGPTIEEQYFRGYLLPRIAYLGVWAPVVNNLFFSLYYFWSPWQIIGRILAMTPMYYAVWWKRNIYLGILVHDTVNVISALMLLALILRISIT